MTGNWPVCWNPPPSRPAISATVTNPPSNAPVCYGATSGSVTDDLARLAPVPAGLPAAVPPAVEPAYMDWTVTA